MTEPIDPTEKRQYLTLEEAMQFTRPPTIHEDVATKAGENWALGGVYRAGSPSTLVRTGSDVQESPFALKWTIWSNAVVFVLIIASYSLFFVTEDTAFSSFAVGLGMGFIVAELARAASKLHRLRRAQREEEKSNAEG